MHKNVQNSVWYICRGFLAWGIQANFFKSRSGAKNGTIRDSMFLNIGHLRPKLDFLLEFHYRFSRENGQEWNGNSWIGKWPLKHLKSKGIYWYQDFFNGNSRNSGIGCWRIVRRGTFLWEQVFNSIPTLNHLKPINS